MMHAMVCKFPKLFNELQAPPVSEFHFIMELLMKVTMWVLVICKGWPGNMYKDALKYKKLEELGSLIPKPNPKLRYINVRIFFIEFLMSWRHLGRLQHLQKQVAGDQIYAFHHDERHIRLSSSFNSSAIRIATNERLCATVTLRNGNSLYSTLLSLNKCYTQEIYGLLSYMRMCILMVSHMTVFLLISLNAPSPQDLNKKNQMQVCY